MIAQHGSRRRISAAATMRFGRSMTPTQRRLGPPIGYRDGDGRRIKIKIKSRKAGETGRARRRRARAQNTINCHAEGARASQGAPRNYVGPKRATAPLSSIGVFQRIRRFLAFLAFLAPREEGACFEEGVVSQDCL